MLTRRRFLGYTALVPATLSPTLWAYPPLQGPDADQPAPQISARAQAVHKRALVFDGHVHALDREFYHGGSMGTRKTDGQWDLRRAQPYECYPELDFAIPTRTGGDTYDRYIVRVQEMRQSVRILRQCLEKLEPGEIRGKVPRVIKPPAEEIYAAVESPKGELGFYCVSNGTNRPYRMHVRPPSFINLQVLPKLAKGHLISDLVALIGTIDIVLGEVDR